MIPFIMSGGGSDDPIFTGNYSQLLGTSWDLDTQAMSGNIWGPKSIYHNGNTYTVLKRSEISSDGEVVILKYSGDISNVQVIHITDAVPLLKDYHDYPVIAIDDSGYIWIVLEQHSTIPRIYKSNSPEDISAWTKQTPIGLTGRNYDYPKYGFTSTLKHFMLARYYIVTGVRYGLCFHTSPDGITWTKTGNITEALDEGGATDTRHYPFIPANWIQDDFVHFLFHKRMYVGSPWVEPYVYTMKTPTNPATFGKVWYNYQGTFNKDITVSGVITEAELNANCLVVNDPTLLNENSNPDGIISDNELICKTSINDGLYTYSSGWNKVSNKAGASFLNKNSRVYFTRFGTTRTAFQRLSSDLSEIEKVGNPATPPPVPGATGMAHNVDALPNGNKFMVVIEDHTNNTDIGVAGFNDVYLYECIK